MARIDPYRIVTAVRHAGNRCGASERAQRDAACYLLRVDRRLTFERIIEEIGDGDPINNLSKINILQAINTVSLAMILEGDQHKLTRTITLARRDLGGF